MWSRSPERKEGELTGNLQCNCFGESPPSQQYFLTLQKNVQIKKQVIRSSREQQTLNSLKNSTKKSLRKNSNDAPITSRTRDRRQEYYGNQPFSGVSQLHHHTKNNNEDQLRSTFRSNRSRHPIARQISPPVTQVVNPSLQKTSSWQTIRFPVYFYEPQPLFVSPPKIATHPNIPVSPVNFNISHLPQQSFPQNYSPLPSPRDSNHKQKQRKLKKQVSIHDLKEQVAINFQQLNKDSYSRMNEDIIDFELTQDNADTPRIMPIQKKKSAEYISIPSKNTLLFPPHEINSLKDAMASRIQKPKSNTKKQTNKSRIDVGLSRIDTKKSCLDPSKSKIMVKVLREERKNLKKMDDVEEIRSMVDSDQDISQDKQSVVLGRLHQYGSMLDPSLSLTNPTTPTLSLTTPSIRSKLISMNTQSSTIEKSYLRPFEYSMDRNHFK